MDGDFGVFDGTDLIAQFCDDVSAEEHRSDLLEMNVPEQFRRSAYDDLDVYEVPEDYPLWEKLLKGMRAARNRDLAIVRAVGRLQAAQRARWEARYAAA